MCKRPGFKAAERNHRAENERPDAHDPTAHFILDDRLQHGIRGGEKELHAESSEGEKD